MISNDIAGVSAGFFSDEDDQPQAIDRGFDDREGRFQIIRELARGGLGIVYLAEDRDLKREVALKQIRTERANDARYREKFIQETLIAGQLEHPGIVPVYAAGLDESGQLFYAMRLIRGQSMSKEIADFHGEGGSQVRFFAAAKFRRLLRSFIEVCNAVGYAHERSIIHRDLKPSNVMMGGHGETLLLDWGLSKCVGSVETVGQSADSPNRTTPLMSGSSGSEPTVQGAFLGTLQYASPEQLRGDIDQVTRSSDIFSLGAFLFTILTGKPIVPKDASLSDALKIHERNHRVYADLEIGDSPSALVAVAKKATSLDPAERYPSAEALASDVEAWLADEPIAVHRDPASVRGFRWIRKHRALTSLAIGFVITTVVASLIAIPILQRSRVRAEAEGLKSKQLLSRAIVSENATAKALSASEATLSKFEQMVAFNAISSAFRLLEQNRPKDAYLELDGASKELKPGYKDLLPWRLAKSMSRLQPIELPKQNGTCLASRWHQDGKQISAILETESLGGEGCELFTWSWPQMTLLSSKVLSNDQFNHAAISDDGRFAAIYPAGGIEILSLTDGTPKKITGFQNAGSPITFEFSPSGRYFCFSSGYVGTVVLDCEKPDLENHGDVIFQKKAAFYPCFIKHNGTEYVACLLDKQALVTELPNGIEQNEGNLRGSVTNLIRNYSNYGADNLAKQPRWAIFDDAGDYYCLGQTLFKKQPHYNKRWNSVGPGIPAFSEIFIDNNGGLVGKSDQEIIIRSTSTGVATERFAANSVQNSIKISPHGQTLSFINKLGNLCVIERSRSGHSTLDFPMPPPGWTFDLGVFSKKAGAYNNSFPWTRHKISEVAVSPSEEFVLMASGNVAAIVDSSSGNLVGDFLISDWMIERVEAISDTGMFAIELRDRDRIGLADPLLPPRHITWDGFTSSENSNVAKKQFESGPPKSTNSFHYRDAKSSIETADGTWRFVGDETDIKVEHLPSGRFVGPISYKSDTARLAEIGRTTGSLYCLDHLSISRTMPVQPETDRAGQAPIRVDGVRIALLQSTTPTEFTNACSAWAPDLTESEIAAIWTSHIQSKAKSLLASIKFSAMCLTDIQSHVDTLINLDQAVRQQIRKDLSIAERDEIEFENAWRTLVSEDATPLKYRESKETIIRLNTEKKIDGARFRVALALSHLRLGDVQSCRNLCSDKSNNHHRWRHHVEAIIAALSTQSEYGDTSRANLQRSFDSPSDSQRLRSSSILPLIAEIELLLQDTAKESPKQSANRIKSNDPNEVAVANFRKTVDKKDSQAAIIALRVESDLKQRIEYRCYEGNGYSGVRRFQSKSPWVTLERNVERQNGMRRVVLDSGPYFETIELDVKLEPGKVANLGVLELTKVPLDRKFSVSGTVNALLGGIRDPCVVYLNTQQMQTNTEGNFMFEDVPIGNHRLTAEVPGYESVPVDIDIRYGGDSEIRKDLTVFRPMNARFEYLVGKSFSAQTSGDSEQGEFSVEIDKSKMKFSDLVDDPTPMLKKCFDETHLGVRVKDGELVLDYFMGPVSFAVLPEEADFSLSDQVPDASKWSSRHPAIVDSCGILVSRGRTPQFSSEQPAEDCRCLRLKMISLHERESSVQNR